MTPSVEFQSEIHLCMKRRETNQLPFQLPSATFSAAQVYAVCPKLYALTCIFLYDVKKYARSPERAISLVKPRVRQRHVQKSVHYLFTTADATFHVAVVRFQMHSN